MVQERRSILLLAPAPVITIRIPFHHLTATIPSPLHHQQLDPDSNLHHQRQPIDDNRDHQAPKGQHASVDTKSGQKTFPVSLSTERGLNPWSMFRRKDRTTNRCSDAEADLQSRPAKRRETAQLLTESCVQSLPTQNVIQIDPKDPSAPVKQTLSDIIRFDLASFQNYPFVFIYKKLIGSCTLSYNSPLQLNFDLPRSIILPFIKIRRLVGCTVTLPNVRSPTRRLNGFLVL
ncbi:hypothetical protein MJO28_003757 [Puccinia striiformis f. sp. tritici]|uniref:Uncharacterized protein n=1 Tax=Puccinia striiformis f. sp. tritici TaxID=168172 RepID=A0ACC0EP61_9BASI|nr:hypothetical protein MJO28_003757 [Puccinia striiformis f. sp. tritici]